MSKAVQANSDGPLVGRGYNAEAFGQLRAIGGRGGNVYELKKYNDSPEQDKLSSFTAEADDDVVHGKIAAQAILNVQQMTAASIGAGSLDDIFVSSTTQAEQQPSATLSAEAVPLLNPQLSLGTATACLTNREPLQVQQPKASPSDSCPVCQAIDQLEAQLDDLRKRIDDEIHVNVLNSDEILKQLLKKEMILIDEITTLREKT